MEKRNYVKPEIGYNSLKTASFIAGSKDGGGGIVCNEYITDTILEYLFMISTESSDQGAVDTAKLKCYLQDKNISIKVKTGFEGDISGTGITLTQSGRNKLAQIAGVSFNDDSYYEISVNDLGCFEFTKTTSGDAPYHNNLTDYVCN